MNKDLRDRFDARDAPAIVSWQMDDSRRTLMCESVLESAQFALMLIQQAQQCSRGLAEWTLRVRGVDETAGLVLLDWRRGSVAFPVDGLDVAHFVPVFGESMHPFLIRGVTALLAVFDAACMPADVLLAA